MEKDTLQQRLEIAEVSFPIGAKVCNLRLGSVGIISGKPFISESMTFIFLPVDYPYGQVHDDIESLFVIKTVKKGVRKHS